MYMWMTTLDFSLSGEKYIRKKKKCSEGKYIEEILKKLVTSVRSFYKWSKWSTWDATEYFM
jgi:hypothetical protein